LNLATYQIKNISANYVYLDTDGDMKGDTKLAVNGTYTFQTDASGRYYSNPTLLPYGTYEISEVTPPVGYLKDTIRGYIEFRGRKLNL
jgi:hypothetical protein